MDKSLVAKMEDELAEKLQDAFHQVAKSKDAFYSENPDKVPTVAEIDSLISASAYKNAAISGGASLVPGPWGMLAVVPELVLVTKNQIELIYDIARAHQKKPGPVPTELLLGIFVSAMGTSAGSVLVLHGSQYLVRRASLRVMQQIIRILGGKIGQQALKSALSKWLPGIGAAAMAVWTNYLTRQIGKKADEIMRAGVSYDETAPEVVEAEVNAPSVAQPVETSLDFCKLQVLVSLVRIDGTIAEEEAGFIQDEMARASLSSEERDSLQKMLAGESRPLEGMERIAASPDDAITLLSTMTALAKRDNNFHVTEKLYIRKVGKLIGFAENDIEEVMAAG